MIHMVAITVMTTPRRKLRVSSPANSRLERAGTGAGQLRAGAGVGVVRLKWSSTVELKSRTCKQ